MMALSLHAAGWELGGAEPIDTVFTDPAFLGKWVVPAQLIALAIYARPLFRNVHVHGSLHVVQRHNQDASASAAHDEERYLYRTAERPMRRRVGNTVEPTTLVQRFGADALRLWYLLALRPGAPRTVLREELGAAARQQVHRLNVVLSFLLESTREERGIARPHKVDSVIVAKVRELANVARAAYPKHAYERAARAFLEAVERIAKYAKWASDGDTVRDRAATRATLVPIIQELERGFSPICPFILGQFANEIRGRASDASQFHGWADALVMLATLKGRPVRIGFVDPAVRASLLEHATAIASVLGVPIEWIEGAPGDDDRVAGPFFRKGARAGA